MYNQAAKDPALAKAIAQAVKDAGEDIILMGLANSEFEKAAKELGVPFAAEAFADRGYMPDGSLVPRSQPGAIIHDVDAAAKRVVRMVTEGTVEAWTARPSASARSRSYARRHARSRRNGESRPRGARGRRC